MASGNPIAVAPQVWLIKSESAARGDSYADGLQADGFDVRYFPALAEEYDTQALEELLLVPGSTNTWHGVIICSKRGAEGYIRAAQAVVAKTGNIPAFDLSSVKLYTVGETALDILSTADLPFNALPETSCTTQAKSAALLAEKILADAMADVQQQRTFLYIRGDKTLDTLQPTLRAAGHTVHECQVYSTSPNPDFGQLVSDAIHGLAPAPGTPDIHLVFFSPSSSGFALPHLGRLMLAGSVGEGAVKIGRVKVIAIGETTKAFLVRPGITVDATADEPNASGLARALRGIA